MKLYVYDHCPFCVRARMIFGLKNLPVELVVLANDDEATPIGLVGKKVVPILVKEDGTAMPESLDIVHYVDEYFGEKILSEHVRPEIETWLKEVGSYYGHLTTARFTKIGLAEFETQSAAGRAYFQPPAAAGDSGEFPGAAALLPLLYRSLRRSVPSGGERRMNKSPADLRSAGFFAER